MSGKDLEEPLNKPARELSAGTNDVTDRDALLHELELHAVELERNNQELRRTRGELEALKDRYLDLYDFAPVAYFTLDTGGVIREVNLAGSNLLGFARQKLVGKPFIQFVDKDMQGVFLSSTRHLKSVVGPRRLELCIHTADGRKIHTLLEIARVASGVEQDEELRLVASDISERKLLEEQREMFFTITSHELRTPVTNLNLSLDMVLGTMAGRLDSDVLAILEVARRGVKRLGKLVEDILQLRDIRDSKLPAQQRRLDLASLLDEAVVLNRPYAAKFKVEIEVSENLSHAWVYAHEGRLLQVFNNLLTNAVKHSPDGGRVSLKLELRAGSFRVSVRDQGAGVDPMLGERIFLAFTQGEPSLEDERNKGGLGLGLSVGRAIVEQFGGQLNFTREAGETVFYFELPAHGL